MTVRRRAKQVGGPVASSESGAEESGEAPEESSARAADLVDRRNARGGRKPPAMEPALGRVVEVVVAKAQRLLDDPKTFERMERALKVEGAATPEQVRQALNANDEVAADAHLAALAAKAEFERWKAQAEVYEGPMRDEAMRSLQRDKADGQMNKAIAEADVKARIAKLYPDEYQALQLSRSRGDMTVKQFERIADLLQKRSYSLAAMVQPRG